MRNKRSKFIDLFLRNAEIPEQAGFFDVLDAEQFPQFMEQQTVLSENFEVLTKTFKEE